MKIKLEQGRRRQKGRRKYWVGHAGAAAVVYIICVGVDIINHIKKHQQRRRSGRSDATDKLQFFKSFHFFCIYKIFTSS